MQEHIPDDNTQCSAKITKYLSIVEGLLNNDETNFTLLCNTYVPALAQLNKYNKILKEQVVTKELEALKTKIDTVTSQIAEKSRIALEYFNKLKKSTIDAIRRGIQENSLDVLKIEREMQFAYSIITPWIANHLPLGSENGSVFVVRYFHYVFLNLACMRKHASYMDAHNLYAPYYTVLSKLLAQALDFCENIIKSYENNPEIEELERDANILFLLLHEEKKMGNTEDFVKEKIQLMPNNEYNNKLISIFFLIHSYLTLYKKHKEKSKDAAAVFGQFIISFMERFAGGLNTDEIASSMQDSIKGYLSVLTMSRDKNKNIIKLTVTFIEETLQDKKRLGLNKDCYPELIVYEDQLNNVLKEIKSSSNIHKKIQPLNKRNKVAEDKAIVLDNIEKNLDKMKVVYNENIFSLIQSCCLSLSQVNEYLTSEPSQPSYFSEGNKLDDKSAYKKQYEKANKIYQLLKEKLKQIITGYTKISKEDFNQEIANLDKEGMFDYHLIRGSIEASQHIIQFYTNNKLSPDDDNGFSLILDHLYQLYIKVAGVYLSQKALSEKNKKGEIRSDTSQFLEIFNAASTYIIKLAPPLGKSKEICEKKDSFIIIQLLLNGKSIQARKIYIQYPQKSFFLLIYSLLKLNEICEKFSEKYQDAFAIRETLLINVYNQITTEFNINNILAILEIAIKDNIMLITPDNNLQLQAGGLTAVKEFITDTRTITKSNYLINFLNEQLNDLERSLSNTEKLGLSKAVKNSHHKEVGEGRKKYKEYSERLKEHVENTSLSFQELIRSSHHILIPLFKFSHFIQGGTSQDELLGLLTTLCQQLYRAIVHTNKKFTKEEITLLNEISSSLESFFIKLELECTSYMTSPVWLQLATMLSKITDQDELEYTELYIARIKICIDKIKDIYELQANDLPNYHAIRDKIYSQQPEGRKQYRQATTQTHRAKKQSKSTSVRSRNDNNKDLIKKTDLNKKCPEKIGAKDSRPINPYPKGLCTKQTKQIREKATKETLNRLKQQKIKLANYLEAIPRRLGNIQSSLSHKFDKAPKRIIEETTRRLNEWKVQNLLIGNNIVIVSGQMLPSLNNDLPYQEYLSKIKYSIKEILKLLQQYEQKMQPFLLFYETLTEEMQEFINSTLYKEIEEDIQKIKKIQNEIEMRDNNFSSGRENNQYQETVKSVDSAFQKASSQFDELKQQTDAQLKGLKSKPPGGATKEIVENRLKSLKFLVNEAALAKNRNILFRSTYIKKYLSLLNQLSDELAKHNLRLVAKEDLLTNVGIALVSRLEEGFPLNTCKFSIQINKESDAELIQEILASNHLTKVKTVSSPTVIQEEGSIQSSLSIPPKEPIYYERYIREFPDQGTHSTKWPTLDITVEGREYAFISKKSCIPLAFAAAYWNLRVSSEEYCLPLTENSQLYLEKNEEFLLAALVAAKAHKILMKQPNLWDYGEYCYQVAVYCKRLLNMPIDKFPCSPLFSEEEIANAENKLRSIYGCIDAQESVAAMANEFKNIFEAGEEKNFYLAYNQIFAFLRYSADTFDKGIASEYMAAFFKNLLQFNFIRSNHPMILDAITGKIVKTLMDDLSMASLMGTHPKLSPDRNIRQQQIQQWLNGYVIYAIRWYSSQTPYNPYAFYNQQPDAPVRNILEITPPIGIFLPK